MPSLLRQDHTGECGCPQNCKASLWFLDEVQQYKTVKPYRLDFPPEDRSFPRTNFEGHEAKDVQIHDMRNCEIPLSFEENGFTVISSDSTITAEECEVPEKLQELLYDGLTESLKSYFGTPHVFPLSHTVRVRHQTFPLSTGKAYSKSQPVLMAHVDWTPTSFETEITSRWGEGASLMRGKRVVIVHAWKPLIGPVKDWPLSLCDALTVDPAKDLEAADLVYEDRVDENFQVYRRDSQRWFYLSDQNTSEVLLFRQYDTRLGLGSGIPHAAIPDPFPSGSPLPRESIEIPILVYWDEE